MTTQQLVPFNTALGTFSEVEMESLLDADDRLSPVYIETTHHIVVGRIKELRAETFDVFAAGTLHTFGYDAVEFVAWASVGTPTQCAAKPS